MTERASKRARVARAKPAAPVVAGLRFAAATPERWNDLVRLFGPNGACAGCWCMYYRQTSTEFNTRKGESNRRALRRLVGGSCAPGLLAYAGDAPVGWCAVAPRAEYTRLGRSRNLAPVDDQPVWSVPCLFVARDWRRRGVTARLLDAAAAHARAHDARILEGYPLVPQAGAVPAAFAWNGFLPAFEAAGFAVAARRSARQVIARRRLDRNIPA